MSTVMIFNGDKSTVESTQPAWEASAAPRTPQAQIRYKDRTFTVENGSTIGCLRHANMPAPTIQLPPAECPGTSHQHGTFSHARGQWTFTNKGTNGTLLMRGGESIPIRGSESHQLQSGDVLFLGCKESRIVFETSTHEA